MLKYFLIQDNGKKLGSVMGGMVFKLLSEIGMMLGIQLRSHLNSIQGKPSELDSFINMNLELIGHLYQGRTLFKWEPSLIIYPFLTVRK